MSENKINKPVVLDETLKDVSGVLQNLNTKLTPAVDPYMSTVSTNPVQNKVITKAVNDKFESVTLTKDNTGTRKLTFKKGNGSTSVYDLSFAAATGQESGLMTPEQHNKLANIQEGAEVNQPAFSKVKVGAKVIESSNKQETIEFLPGTNVSLTADTTNKRLTINSTVNARDLVHINTTLYWNSQPQLVGKPGHIYIYTDHDQIQGVNIPGLKIGDGLGYLIDAPFIDSNASTVEDHINNTDIHVTPEEKDFWNNKVTCFLDSADNENIIFTKAKEEE